MGSGRGGERGEGGEKGEGDERQPVCVSELFVSLEVLQVCDPLHSVI